MAKFPSKGNMDQFRTMVRKVLAYRPPKKKVQPRKLNIANHHNE